MFRSLSRLTVAVAFVLALVLSTAPAQALPLGFGSGFGTLDASWLDAALSWFEGLLGGGGAAEPLQSMETASTSDSTSGPGDVSTTGGSCLDPWGGGCDW